jgi:hypothetical protein
LLCRLGSGGPSGLVFIRFCLRRPDHSETCNPFSYKLKLQQAKAPRQKKNPNEPQAAFAIMDRAILKIQKIDTSAWTEEDNTAFRDSLPSLKAQIDHYPTPPSNLA